MTARAGTLALAVVLAAPAAAGAAVVDAGPVKARFGAQPPRLVVEDRTGRELLRARFSGSGLALRVRRAGRGVLAVRLRARRGRPAASFGRARRELFTGFGERSNAVNQAGRVVLNYVSDGPYLKRDRPIAGAIAPPFGYADRDDDTYYPVPWLLSSRGYGVLIDNEETSRFDLAPRGRWSVVAEAATLELRIFGGPRPADALRRFTAATGRQPAPPAPWAYGPWFQTGQPNVTPLAEEAAIVRTFRDADAPVSAAETQMHFLPCGAHRGREAYELARTRQFHAAGLAHLSYFNPHLCTAYQPVYDQAVAARALQLGPDGRPITFPAFVGGESAAGFTVEPLAQFDFTAPGAAPLYARLVREAFAQGKDGFMEDFGEYTSPRVRSADGTPPARIHNRYPRDYHCALQRITRGLGRPLVRFQRSGWTGAARCSVNVWGGDPTTVWGFDGLRSAVTQALTIGMSGVARWGSDIGGYTSFGTRERLTRELLDRWIQLGAVSGLMRTKRSGIALPAYERPQVFDPASLPLWRRYAKLHTQLLPYIEAADAEYRATGMPLMRHGLLTDPRDPRAVRADNQFGFGGDLLAAPVLRPGARRRSLYLPHGRWVDLWRSARYVARDGSVGLGRARSLGGGRRVTLPAPLDELPLLVRAGAVLPLLPADVDTLAPYAGPGVVRLADRRDRMQLLAFPRGRTESRMGARRERLASAETARGWTLAVRGRRARRYSLQASLATLRRPFTPRRLLLAGRPLPRSAWSYDARRRVLRVEFRCRSAVLAVRR
ncbi:MAG: glycoside hydrolase family 31 protein [Thermoleophilaceae bacterium]|nr:glycoside hydrolase family 31 protein [Thermoleophilaceae bacterium]